MDEFCLLLFVCCCHCCYCRRRCCCCCLTYFNNFVIITANRFVYFRDLLLKQWTNIVLESPRFTGFPGKLHEVPSVLQLYFVVCMKVTEGQNSSCVSLLYRIPQLLTCLVRREGQKILNLLCNIGRVHPQVS